eukprot:UN29591
MTEARAIGYTGMVGEGTLAIMSLVLCTSAITDWESTYSKTGGKLGAFMDGGGNCLQEWGFSATFSESAMALLVVSFAATTLDSAVRIQRVLLTEFGAYLRSIETSPQVDVVMANVAWGLENKIIAGLIAIVPAVWLANSKTVTALWQLFGATNQLIAALTLTIVAVYLYNWKGSYYWIFAGLPALVLYCFIPWALIAEL